MKLSYFFKISWSVQLLVGLGLFLVSFLIESAVLTSFIATPILAILLAIALEAGKAVAIVWHRYLNSDLMQADAYPKSTKIASAGFRIGLVGLSALCSLLYLAGNLDRPNLDSVRSHDLQQLEQTIKNDFSVVENNLKQQRAQLFNRHQREYQILQENYGTRVSNLENDLKNEMNNVVKGYFKGPRYKEISAQLKDARERRDAALTQLTVAQAKARDRHESTLQDQEREMRQHIKAQADEKRLSITHSDYAVDDRANDSRIVAFLKMTESVFNLHFLPLQFVFGFSLLISLLMEIGIMLAFETITVAILPALSAQHEEAIRKEVLDAKINGEMERDDFEHKAAVTRIRNSADRVMQKANEYMNATSNESQ